MDVENGEMGMHEEVDRLSTLPNDLIHKILSYVDIRDVIRTSGLSSRWRFIWTSMPYLNLSSMDFATVPKFAKFITSFLPRRNSLTDVHSLKLSFRAKVSLKVAVGRLLEYAFAHNIQRLEVICNFENDVEFPLSIYRSQSLKHLSVATNFDMSSKWELPSLTTLDLHNVTLCDTEADQFFINISRCTNLKNLTLTMFHTRRLNHFGINHRRLSNLTIKYSFDGVEFVNVFAPQLENLTIISIDARVVISAPNLVSLLYNGSPLHTTDGFHSLEKADICVPYPELENADEIVCMLQHLHNVQYLTLNLEIVEFLSSFVELFKHKPSPFLNLKSLKIHPHQWNEISKEITVMCDELKSYLLDSSPGSTFTMVVREEVKAQEIMDELRVILKKEKDDTETNQKLNIGGDIAQIKKCLESLRAQVEKARVIISKLQAIEDLVIKLPALKRAKIQPCFSSLCAEADIAISLITDRMKIECDENQSLSSVCFQMNLLQHWRRFLSKLSVPYSRE